MGAVQEAPAWFLLFLLVGAGIAISALFGGLLWSIRAILKGIQDDLRALFDKHDNHESRLARLEGKCKAEHGG